MAQRVLLLFLVQLPTVQAVIYHDCNLLQRILMAGTVNRRGQHVLQNHSSSLESGQAVSGLTQETSPLGAAKPAWGMAQDSSCYMVSVLSIVLPGWCQGLGTGPGHLMPGWWFHHRSSCDQIDQMRKTCMTCGNVSESDENIADTFVYLRLESQFLGIGYQWVVMGTKNIVFIMVHSHHLNYV
jgi:hypothetical protein